MDLSRTITPKSDQINFDDVQSQCITAVVKYVRQGSKEQPVFIYLDRCREIGRASCRERV